MKINKLLMIRRRFWTKLYKSNNPLVYLVIPYCFIKTITEVVFSLLIHPIKTYREMKEQYEADIVKL